MDNTAITLIVNGRIEDYDRHLKKVVAEALGELLPQLQRKEAASGFSINPNMAYRVADPRIIELFGCQHVEKNPSQAVINRLRSVGIEPLTRGRSGATVFGNQILEYMEAVKKKTHPFLVP